MSQISRVHTAEIQNGQIIDADDLSDEYNNIISETNAQDLRLVDLESSNMVINGSKTFTDPIIVNTVSERTVSSGVQIDSVRLKDGMVLVAGTPTTNGEIGYISNRFTVYQNGNLTNFAPYSTLSSRSADSQLTLTNWGAAIICTGTFTQTFAASSSLTAGWFIDIRNDGTGVITLDPNSSELVDGFATVNLGPGNSCRVICDGTGLKTVGRKQEYIYMDDRKAQNSSGGTFTSGAFRTRTLNTKSIDTANVCSLSSNQFTLQPGTYRINASAPAGPVNNHQAILQNITDATTTLVGTSENSASGAFYLTQSRVRGQFSITAAKTFELQHQCQTTRSSDGFGLACNFTTEVYAIVELWKVI